MKQLALFVGLAWMGCAGEPTSALTQGIEPGGGYVSPEEEHNGRYMLSELLDGAPFKSAGAYFSIDLAGTGVAFAGSASLVLNRVWNNPALERLRFSVNEVTSISLAVSGGTPDVTRYRVTRYDAGKPQLICSDAVPLMGIIRDDGLHVRDPSRITLACGTGAAGKCVEFGYAPGPGGVPWDAHQACMRAVRADYCGNGDAHTRIGTAIAILDRAGVYPADPAMSVGGPSHGAWPPPAERYFFEAAFAGGDRPAVCVRRMRWPGPLPSSCLGDIADEVDCDDPATTVGELEAHGAMLFIGSYYNTLRIDAWWRADGDHGLPDMVTTIAGYRGRDGEEIKPMRSYGNYQFLRRDGILLRVPPNNDTTNLTAVYSYREIATDRFVLSSIRPPFDNPVVYEQGPQEGWVYNTPPGGVSSRALKLYQHTGGDFWSTTGAVESPWSPYPSASGNTIGWVRVLQ